eukprot:scaffold118228_cov69-Phaeocystis_antarctica.AAC.2
MGARRRRSAGGQLKLGQQAPLTEAGNAPEVLWRSQRLCEARARRKPERAHRTNRGSRLLAGQQPSNDDRQPVLDGFGVRAISGHRVEAGMGTTSRRANTSAHACVPKERAGLRCGLGHRSRGE